MNEIPFSTPHILLIERWPVHTTQMPYSVQIATLQSTSVLQHLIQLALLCLQIRVASNMLMGDKDVWYGTLAGHLLKGVLNGSSVI